MPLRVLIKTANFTKNQENSHGKYIISEASIIQTESAIQTNSRICKKTATKIIAYLCSILFILGLWQFLAIRINSVLVLPSPVQILKNFPSIITNLEFWKSFLATFIRVMISFLISLFLGILLGFITACSSFFKNFFTIPLQIIRITPVITIILIAIFWFNSSILPVFVAVLMILCSVFSLITPKVQTV